MKDKGVRILKGTGTALLIWSVIEIIIEILNVMKYDLASIGAGSLISDLFLVQAGNSAVSILLSIVGLAAAAAAITLADNDRFNRWLRLFGIALIVIYVIEGVMLAGASPDWISWIRLIIVLVFAALYLYGSWLLKEEDDQFEQQNRI